MESSKIARGRPKKNRSSILSKHVVVNVSEAEKEKIALYCAETGISESGLLRSLLKKEGIL